MTIIRKLLIFALSILVMAPAAAFGQVDGRAEMPSAPPLAAEFSTGDKGLGLTPSVVNNFSVEQRRLKKLSGREADYALPIEYTTSIIQPQTCGMKLAFVPMVKIFPPAIYSDQILLPQLC
jgi:hypothetical protein